MAADILLYQTDIVPVGDDQKQHVELTRDLAERFNGRYGTTFRVPMPVIQQVTARIYDLQNPTAKMSKSAESDAGVLWLLDEPAKSAKKVMRAVTDSEGSVRYDRENKPGVSNLLVIYAALTGRQIPAIEDEYAGSRYGLERWNCSMTPPNSTGSWPPTRRALSPSRARRSATSTTGSGCCAAPENPAAPRGRSPDAVPADHDVASAVDKHDLTAQVRVLGACQPSEQPGNDNRFGEAVERHGNRLLDHGTTLVGLHERSNHRRENDARRYGVQGNSRPCPLRQSGVATNPPCEADLRRAVDEIACLGVGRKFSGARERPGFVPAQLQIDKPRVRRLQARHRRNADGSGRDGFQQQRTQSLERRDHPEVVDSDSRRRRHGKPSDREDAIDPAAGQTIHLDDQPLPAFGCRQVDLDIAVVQVHADHPVASLDEEIRCRLADTGGSAGHNVGTHLGVLSPSRRGAERSVTLWL